MKIICIGRNYAAHAAEMKSAVPDNPMIFMKPPTALLLKDKPMYIPEFTKDLHYEAEIVIKIAKNGRHVQEEFASEYYNQIAFGIDFTARDLQSKLKEKGHPWEIAKAFNGSAPVGKFIEKSSLNDPNNINFQLSKNGEIVQKGQSNDMIFSFSYLIAHLSRYFLIGKGDLIFTGTPAGVGPTIIGDTFTGSIEGHELLKCAVK